MESEDIVILLVEALEQCTWAVDFKDGDPYALFDRWQEILEDWKNDLNR